MSSTSRRLSWRNLASLKSLRIQRGNTKPRLLVIGVGGAGGNAVNNMVSGGLAGVEFCIMNTDAQAIAQSAARNRIRIGASVTRGLGAGARVEIGRAAAEESLGDIAAVLRRADMVFVTAGMGGGTGTGAAPVIARAARDVGILTVGVVTKPFHFEGAHRMRQAEAGIVALREAVDTLLVIPNQNLFRVSSERTTFGDAFKMADQVLHAGVQSVSDLIVVPGLINLDFADIRTVMKDMGTAMMGVGEAQGESRAVDAAEAAISNPLLDAESMRGARGVLVNITGGPDMTLVEVERAAERVRQEADPEANIIFGSAFDERLDGRMRVSVVATGLDRAPAFRDDGADRWGEPDAHNGERTRWDALDDMPEPVFAPVRGRAPREAAGLPARLPNTAIASAAEPTFITASEDVASKRDPARGGRWGHRLAGAGLLTVWLGGTALYDHYAGNSVLAVAEPRAEMVMAGNPAEPTQRTPAASPSEPIAPADVADSPAAATDHPPDGSVAPPAPLPSPPAKTGAKVSRAPSRSPAGSAEPEYQLQLAALPTEEAAWQEWNRLRRLHADLLGSLRALGTRVEMADQGSSLWRVRVGPIPSAEAAERICAELKRRQAPCLLFIRRS